MPSLNKVMLIGNVGKEPLTVSIRIVQLTTQVDVDEEGEPVYKGVVFNEMKGALSDPESVLYHAMNKALFPGTCYAFESGGRPRAIPQLKP